MSLKTKFPKLQIFDLFNALCFDITKIKGKERFNQHKSVFFFKQLYKAIFCSITRLDVVVGILRVKKRKTNLSLPFIFETECLLRNIPIIENEKMFHCFIINKRNYDPLYNVIKKRPQIEFKKLL